MRTKETLLGLLVLGLVVTGVFWARGRGHSDQAVPGHADPVEVDGSHGSSEEALADATRADAVVDLGDVRVTLSLTPQPPVAFEKLRVRVRVEAQATPTLLEAGRISFEMLMPMGDHRYTLVPADAGWYEAEAVLPFCKSGNPRWYAIVDGTVAGRAITARFRLDLTRRPSA